MLEAVALLHPNFEFALRFEDADEYRTARGKPLVCEPLGELRDVRCSRQRQLPDRFGALPPAATQLFHNARLTQQCRALGLRRLDVSTQSSYLVFEEKNAIDPGAVIKLLQKEPRVYRLEGPLKLRIARGAEPAARFEFAQRLLAGLR